jgi:hypothetical protein
MIDIERQRRNRIETINDLLTNHSEELTQWEGDFLRDMGACLFLKPTLSDEQIEKYREIRRKIRGY